MSIVKKYKRITVFVFAVLIFILISSNATPARALESTYYTYAISLNHETYIRIPDAYIPGGIFMADIGMSSPEDMFYHNKLMFIADTGNGRIVRYDMETGVVMYLGEGELTAPTGVAVAEDGRIFVADYGAEQITVFSADGEVLQHIGRPQDIFYGKSTYKPRKVGIDSYGNILALSEGTHEGILQFMPDGSFAGFFGANRTKGLSLVEWVQKTFYTEEQKAQLYFRTPPSIASLHVADNNIFTVTQNDRWYSLKKLNLAGVDVLPAFGSIYGEDNFVDLTVAPNGNIIAVTDTGSIEEFDRDGWDMFNFGGRAVASDRNGLTSVVSAIDIDGEYTVYLLDKERALIQTYIPTEFTNVLHKASEDYNAGNYVESLAGWEEIMRMCPMASMAHSGYAGTLFQLGEYERAAYHYKLNGSRSSYSRCFGEMRSAWFRANMNTLIIIVIALVALIITASLIRKRKDFMAPVSRRWSNAKQKFKLLKDVVSEPFYMMRHPIDCLYDLKIKKRGSAVGASLLYLAALIVFFVDWNYTSFVFGGGIGWWADPGMMLLTAIAPVALFWVGSYLVSSIHGGEGTIKQTYTAFGYAFTPFIVFTPLMTILSHALTVRENFIFLFLRFLIAGYTCVLLFLSLKETYGYNGKRTVVNLLLTAGFMLIAALGLIILFVLWRQLLSFVSEIFEEVRYRAFR